MRERLETSFFRSLSAYAAVFNSPLALSKTSVLVSATLPTATALRRCFMAVRGASTHQNKMRGLSATAVAKTKKKQETSPHVNVQRIKMKKI